MISSQSLAKEVRLSSVKMCNRAGSSHIGSALSIADILAVLYSSTLNVRPDTPDWEDRDRFILSKGHACAALYATLAEIGFFPIDLLMDHCKDDSILCGHASHKVPGVEISTGSLGQGLAIGSGFSFAAKKRQKKWRTVVLMSDGECDEGSVWETALFAGHHRLDNLTAIIDYNRLQSIDSTDNTLGLEPLKKKWESFGWEVLEVDGHNHKKLQKAFKHKNSKPLCIICNTIKGKGVSFMEGSVLWHYRCPKGEEFQQALDELSRL